MSSQMVAYKAELNQRYWEYQKSRFPEWQKFFDRPSAQDLRPPVFRTDEAWRNIIIKPNASPSEIESILALIPGYDRHKWFRSMNSSQALAQSVLGNLAVYGYLNAITELQDDDGQMLLGEARATSDSFAMEYKIDYLGEPRSTSLDGYLGGSYRVAIECKFTEAEVGTCSRQRLTPADSNYQSEHCNGTYTRQRGRVERCSLSEVGVLYWQYLPHFLRWNHTQDLSPCPLYLNYQLVRNILAISVNPDGQTSSDNGHVVVIYDERNPAFQKGGKGFVAFEETHRALYRPAMLRKCSWQRIVRHIRKERILPWLTEQLEIKYGL